MRKRTDWFNEARYGLFIHWGAYAKAARGEWIMNRELIPVEEYRRLYAEKFAAEDFDPADWAAKAVHWGMGYAILTARHHDGFALWNSKVNPYNAAQMGPKRDLVSGYVGAFRNAGLKVGLYYSPANWSHPDYPGGYCRDWPVQGDWRDEEARQRFIAYYRAELKELMTEYGKIDYLWFDGCIPGNLEGAETLEMLRVLQPEMIINNRLGEPYDVKVSEQIINPAPQGQDWEACMTLNDNWGFHAGDHNWKKPTDVIHLLLTCAQSDGNLLLNIGPRAEGTIPQESVAILDAVGDWLKQNRSAIAKSERHPFSWNCTARPITAKGNKVFLHFLKDPCGEFCWGELKNNVVNAYWLDNGEPIAFEKSGNRLFLRNLVHALPARTAVLELDGRPATLKPQTTFWIPE